MNPLAQEVADLALKSARDTLMLIPADAKLSAQINVITTAVRALTAWKSVQDDPPVPPEQQDS